jgi:hypothetical protein
MILLLLAMSLTAIIAAASHYTFGQSSSMSQQDKAKACTDAADKKGLKDADRKTFMENCLNKAAGSGSTGNVSEQDKGTACKNIADKKGLKGSDRRSFLKDCMNKANP